MAHMDKIRVLIVDDHASVRKGLATFLDTIDNLVLVAEAANGPEAFHLCYLFQPDVILLDSQITGLDAVTFTRLIRHMNNQIQVIVLAAGEEDKSLSQAALKAGAVLALQKSVSAGELTQAIEAAYADRPVPSRRKGDVPSQDQPTRLR